jgi:hypothetical protein
MSTTVLTDLLDCIEGRPLEVHLSRSMERRLQASINRFDADCPDDPWDPFSDEDLGVALVACAERGLCAGESDDGLWATPAGRLQSLPRAVRAPLWMRCRFAWSAAVTCWRST